MFMDTRSRIPDNARVRLRDYVDPAFYQGMAKSGNEGWIRKHRTDRNGLPEVYIEWDREHWADNLQPDQWTFEDHFDVIDTYTDIDAGAVDVQGGDGVDISREDWEEFQKFRAMMAAEKAVDKLKSVDSDPEAEEKEFFEAQLTRSASLLGNAEGFFVLAVRRESDPKAPNGVLIVSAASASMTPECEALIGVQLSGFAAKFHEEAGYTLIHHFTSDGGESDIDHGARS